MKSLHAIGLLSAVVALSCLCVFASQASAGFLEVNVSSTTGQYPDVSWNAEDPGRVGIGEVWDSSTGSDYPLYFSGMTDEDPPLTITKDILNGTGTTWIGYNITLDPLDNDTFIGGASSGGTSGGMTLGFQDAYNLLWTTPNPVLPGQTVSFTFTVNVPDDGPFNFTLSQSPVLVPEPASITLFALAMLMFAGLRRRMA